MAARQGHAQRVEPEIGAHVGGDELPADDPARVRVDDELRSGEDVSRDRVKRLKGGGG
jgi:hypothetical protein